jgi:hypothetical protein
VNYPTIQGAINGVPPGTTIKICPGKYYEQLTIAQSLSLVGVASGGADAVVIYPPATGLGVNTTDARGAVAAQILVQNTTGVSISNLTVDGTGNQYNADDLRGILYQDASGIVNHVAVRNEVPNDTPTGIQSGQGIMVETTNSSSALLSVQNSSVHNYNKNGIVARYTGAVLTATGNYVQGAGPIGYIGQNGIEVAFAGAAGTIKSNTVIDNFYTGTDATASDILLYDASSTAGTVAVSSNTVGNSNIGIAVVTSGGLGDNASVTLNKIMGSSIFDGIDVCTNGNTVKSNTIFNSTESGVHLDAGCGGSNNNTVTGNTILETACAGVLDDSSTTGNSHVPNTYFTVPLPYTRSTASCTGPVGLARVAKTRNRYRP